MELEEIKKTVEGLGKAWEAFKQKNDEKEAEEKKRGSADILTKEQLDKINTTLNELTEAKDRLETAVKRAPVPGADGKTTETTEQAEHRKAFNAFMRKGIDTNLGELQKKAMSVGIDPDGGYLAPAQIGDTVVKKVFETSPVRQVFGGITINANSYEYLIDKDEMAASWVGEVASRSDTTTAQVAKGSIPTHEIYAQPKATQTLLDDASFDVEAWIADKVSDKFARAENAAFLTGTGVAQPRGLLSYTAASDSGAGVTWGQIGYVGTGASGDWAASNPSDKLITLVNTLKGAYLQGSSFLMSRLRVNEVRQFKEATTNAYIWQPGLSVNTPETLLGYPIVRCEDMPAKAANSLSVAFGNFRQAYLIVDRIGVRILRDPFTDKPFIKFYTTKRVGGAVINFEAFKVLKFA